MEACELSVPVLSGSRSASSRPRGCAVAGQSVSWNCESNVLTPIELGQARTELASSTHPLRLGLATRHIPRRPPRYSWRKTRVPKGPNRRIAATGPEIRYSTPTCHYALLGLAGTTSAELLICMELAGFRRLLGLPEHRLAGIGRSRTRAWPKQLSSDSASSGLSSRQQDDAPGVGRTLLLRIASR